MIEIYNICYVILVINNADSSKNTKQILKIHLLRGKKRSIYVKRKNIIFLILVTDSITILVGFKFY